MSAMSSRPSMKSAAMSPSCSSCSTVAAARSTGASVGGRDFGVAGHVILRIDREGDGGQEVAPCGAAGRISRLRRPLGP